MARIKIKDLPKDAKISKEELRKIKGGAGSLTGFIKFDGVEGEAQDKDHKDWIDVLSYEAPSK